MMLKEKLTELEHILKEKNPTFYSNLRHSDWNEKKMYQSMFSSIFPEWHLPKEYIELMAWRDGNRAFFERTTGHLQLLSQSYFINGWYFIGFQEAMHHIIERKELFYYKKEYYFPICTEGFGHYLAIKLSHLGKPASGGVYIIQKKRLRIFKDYFIYDSIESMINTVIKCYVDDVYDVKKYGHFTCISPKEHEISQQLNAKSTFWKIAAQSN